VLWSISIVPVASIVATKGSLTPSGMMIETARVEALTLMREGLEVARRRDDLGDGVVSERSEIFFLRARSMSRRSCSCS
jgi:hypothetical protein